MPPVANPCPRPEAGSVVQNPVTLFSSDGVLNVRFSYQHLIDSSGRELFCFMTPDGLQNPTLHVNPGDHLIITLTNNTSVGTGPMMVNPPNCGTATMDSSSVNINPSPNGNVPSWDVTLNYVPITSPTVPNSSNFVPAILNMEPGEKQFWRVSSSSSDTILDL